MSTEPRVLVVEDNTELAENVAEILELRTPHVAIAPNAEVALAAAKDPGFDVALVDLRLPGERDGLSILPELKDSRGGAEVIVVSGHATVESATAAIRLGAFAYLLKPFDAQTLLDMVDRAYAAVSLARERIQLADELRASEALHRAVLGGIDALVVGVDLRGRMTLLNDAARRRLGLLGVDIRGRGFARTVTRDEHADRLNQALAQAIGAGESIPLTLPLRGPGERVVQWRVRPVAEEGETRGVALGVDVTEVAALQQRTVETEALAAMGALTTSLAHEIRNPLNAASLQLAALDRVARKLEDEERRASISRKSGIVREELGRLTEMLEEFLALARPRALRKSRVALHGMLDGIVALEEEAARQENVALTVAPGEPAFAYCDEARVRQATLNLVRNALDALRGRGGTVTLRATVEEGRAVIIVEDDGPGLPDEVEGSPFDAFVTTKEAGTGLGLAIVRKIARMHGGEATLSPRPDGGASARLTLPSA